MCNLKKMSRTLYIITISFPSFLHHSHHPPNTRIILHTILLQRGHLRVFSTDIYVLRGQTGLARALRCGKVRLEGVSEAGVGEGEDRRLGCEFRWF